MIEKGVVKGKYMESIEGRLNHTALITPLCRHFLNRNRKKTYQATKLVKPMIMRGNKRQLKTLDTPAQERKQGNFHQQHH